MWRLRVKECIEYYLQVFKVEKLTLNLNQWDTLERTKEVDDWFANNDTNSLDNNDIFVNLSKKMYLVEINVSGVNCAVDKFIIKIKVIKYKLN
jgi:hypothetical protein